MANTLITSSIVAEETLMELQNNLIFTKLVSKPYDSEFGREGRKSGDTLTVRLPVQFTGRRGETYAGEAIQDRPFTITLAPLYGVDFEMTDVDMKLSIDRISERYLKPAARKIANDIDADGLGLYSTVANYVGTPGTVPADLTPYGLAKVTLDNAGTPMGSPRHIVIDSTMEHTVVRAIQALQNPNGQISAQYTSGSMGQAIGFNWHMSQNVKSHTVGVLGGTTVEVNAATPTEGATTLVTDGWTSAAATRVLAGDVFTIEGVYDVNPISKATLSNLKQFVAAAPAASDASGNLTLTFTEAMRATGPYQNVNALPANNADVYPWKSATGAASASASKVTPQGLAFTPEAFAWISVPLMQPSDVEGSVITDDQLGISIRYLRRYDIDSNKYKCRLDVLGGWSCPRPEFACRIVS